MAGPDRLPPAVILVLGEVLGLHYYSHRRLETLFAEAGFPGEPPDGNCVEKCQRWMKRANEEPDEPIFDLAGSLLVEIMEADQPFDREIETKRKRVRDILQKNGLAYLPGGKIAGGAFASPSRALADILRSRDLTALNREFERAQANIERDPPAAVTAACAILEALFKVYLADEGIALPTKQTIGPLWAEVQGRLGLDPKTVEDVDLKKILGNRPANDPPATES